jgi:hypothetical protein
MPTNKIPVIAKASPGRNFSWRGKISTPSCRAAGITKKFNNVPKPGLSRSGIHKSRTTQLINQVAHPRLMPAFRDIPSERTIHGELPSRDCTKNDSPIPKRKSARERIATRNGARSHRDFAVHEVMGIVGCGRNHSTKRLEKGKDIKAGYLIGQSWCRNIIAPITLSIS